MHRRRHEVGLVADLVTVDFFEQAFVAAAADHVRAFDLDHIPGDFLGFDHGLDLGLLAVVFDHHDFLPVAFFEGSK